MSHTPGPWEVHKAGKDKDEREITTPDGDGIAMVYYGVDLYWGGADTRETDEANARLIAAAPDLLAALQKTVKNHERVTYPDDIPCDCDGCYEGRAAITKATEPA